MLVYQRVHQLETRCRGKKANSLRFARSMSSTASSWPLCCVPGSSRPGSCRMQPCCCLGGPCCLAKRLVVNAWPMWMNFSGKDWLGLPLASCDSKSLSYWWSVWWSEGFPLWRQLVIEVGTAVWCTVSAAACWHYDHLEQCQMPGRDADAAVIWQPHICKVNAEWSPMTWFFFPANLFPNRGFFFRSCKAMALTVHHYYVGSQHEGIKGMTLLLAGGMHNTQSAITCVCCCLPSLTSYASWAKS